MYEDIFSLVETPVGAQSLGADLHRCGAAVMLILVVCYHRFYWWPIHPIGYLTAYSSAMWTLWFSFFLGWLCNALCMRYGGTALFKNLRMFFIGLIIGDFFMAGQLGDLWAVQLCELHGAAGLMRQQERVRGVKGPGFECPGYPHPVFLYQFP